MKLFVISILLLTSLFCCAHQSAMHPKAQIAFVKQQVHKEVEPYYSAYKQLIHIADSLVNFSPNAIEDFSVPGFYINPEGHRKNKLALSGDAFAAYTCALAYKLTGKRNYGKRACCLLDAWATVNKSYSDADGELVMTYCGSGLLIAADLMFDSPVWSVSERKQFGGWVERVYRKAANSIRSRSNNWADWGRFGSLLCASFLDDDQEVQINEELLKSDLNQRIASDGRMIEEIKREKNGIWYSYFSLTPITASCWLIYNRTGENLFLSDREGTLIKKALDYLLYYAENPSQWPWFPNPRSGENEPWPENLFEAMSGIYQDKSFVDFVEQKRPVIYPTHHYAWTFPTLMPLKTGAY